jgi:hypothetical protein
MQEDTEDFLLLMVIIALLKKSAGRLEREPKYSVPFKSALYIQNKLRSRHPHVFFETFRMRKHSFLVLEGKYVCLLTIVTENLSRYLKVGRHGNLTSREQLAIGLSFFSFGNTVGQQADLFGEIREHHS